jgi:hypothetical protein
MLLVLGCPWVGAGYLRAEGIPEPDLVFFGSIHNAAVPGRPRVTSGVLEWTIRPSGDGSPIRLRVALTNLNNQFSYLLRVPCESQVGSLSVSTNAIRLLAPPLTLSYDRSAVTLNESRVAFATPALTNLVVTAGDRGRIEHLDLVLEQACEDRSPAPQRNVR